MKPQHSASKMSPSKLCRILLVAFSLKLTVLGLMVADPALPDVASFFPFGAEKSAVSSSLPGVAHAAEAGAGAPPPVSAVVPDVGMQRPSPGVAPTGSSPGAIPGIAQPGQEGQPTSSNAPDAPRALPSIGSKTPTGSGNATADAASAGLTRDSLAKKQEELARKEQELRALEADISAKLEKMSLLENRLTSMMKEAEETKDAKFRHLVDVMSNMKARQAAEMLQTLDQRIAVRILAGMRGRQAGEILNFVRPEIAANLTAALTRMQLPFE